MKEFKKNKHNYFICEECDKLFLNKRRLAYHINKTHVGTHHYYIKWLKEDNEGVCKICGEKTEFSGFTHFYKNCCSYKCSRKLAANSTKISKKQRYGSEKYNNYSKNLKTCKERHGDEYYNNRKKYKETCNKRYGVDNVTQNLGIFIKAQKKGFKLKQFKETTIYYRGSYELDFLEKYYEIYKDIQNAPTIKFKLNGKLKVYYPDFYIPSLNLIIEIKSLYYYTKYRYMIDIKEKATISSGFKYFMILDKNYSKLYLS